jgi:predicted lipoprotein with Yx(FWY)xxD motif
MEGCVRTVGARPAARALAAAAAAAAATLALASGALSAATPLPGGVQRVASGAGTYYHDANGRPLYTYAQDSRPGQSACVGECAKAWPPLAAAADAAPAGDWSLVVRPDGARQWALRGRPLYTYARDPGGGVALGDRVGNAWSLAFEPVQRPPGIAVRAIYLGRVLTDARGRTLYWRSDEKAAKRGDEPAREACREACGQRFAPLAAPLLANPLGEWDIAPREDGSRQWMFRGRRLYLDGQDFRPGQAEGQGVDGKWEAAVLEPMPPPPTWVTIQNSDMGEIYADAKGMTLYTFSGQLDRVRQLICDDACIARAWRVLPAAAEAQSSGEWTVIDAPAGTVPGGGTDRVWAYKGNVLYTHTRDREPGGIAGDKWAAGVGGGGGGWMPIQRRRDFED